MTPGELWRRLQFWLRRERLARDLDEEMRLHLALRAEQLRAAGVDRTEAVYLARRQFGNETLLKEWSRHMWGWTALEGFGGDVKVAVRSLRRTPLFTAVAILTFALGIGANTAIFSVVNATLLRPLPYPQPEALVHLNLVWKSGDRNDTLTVPEFEFYRDRNSTFAAIAGLRPAGVVAMKQGGKPPAWVTCVRTTDGFFSVLGTHPQLGRSIERGDTRPGSPPVAMLSHSLWQRTFNSDPAVVGQPVEVNGVAYTVVGVLPESFTFVEQPTDLLLSLPLGNTLADTGMNTHVIARVKPGTSIASAQANLDALFKDLRQEGQAQAGQRGVQLEDYQKYLAGDFRASMWLLFGAVTLLLAIACANVASLFMARANFRQREIAIRLAIGSGRFHLLRQFLAESLLVASLGSTAGILAFGWTLKVLLAKLPWNIPLADRVGFDARVLGFALLVTIGTSVLFGFTSYWQTARLDLNSSLKESGSAGGWAQLARNRARSVLVVGEIALSVMLLAGAGLLIDGLFRLHQQRLGFTPDGVLTMTTPFDSRDKVTPAQAWRLEENVLRRVRGTPGVLAAAVTSNLPLSGPDNLPTQQAGHPEHSIGGMEYRAISPAYFDAMRIARLAGRTFTDSDTAASPPVAIVSERVAKAWWKGASPLGDRIVVGEYGNHLYPDVSEQPRQVVGVVADVKNLAIDEEQPTTVYVPASQLPRAPGSMAWVIRGEGGSGLSAVLRKTILAERADQRITEISSMNEMVAHSVARPSFDASLMSIFAGLALALTAVGIYGLLSFQVSRRRREIGIRMALGAKRGELLLMIVRQGAGLALLGIAIGVPGAIGLARLVRSFITGVQGANVEVYALVSALLLAVAIAASFVPAYRASKVDPLTALRYE